MVYEKMTISALLRYSFSKKAKSVCRMVLNLIFLYLGTLRNDDGNAEDDAN